MIPGFVDKLPVSTVKRFARAFVLTFVGVPLAAWIGVGDQHVTGLVDAYRDTWDTAAGYALVVAIGAAGWRALLDPLGVPTLSDANRSEPGPKA